MIDFLSFYRPDSTVPLVTTSTILCDSHGCAARITVTHDIDEAQGIAIARDAGWTARRGTQRAYHRCARCSEGKR